MSTQPTCIIAGAGPGLGLAIAERYAYEGFATYILSRRAEALTPLIAQMPARESRIVPVLCDVTDTRSVGNAVRTVLLATRRCDVLVYNATSSSRGRISDLDPESAVADFRVNVAGALALVNVLIEEMRARGDGTILFSGCGLADHPSPERASLSMGKAALRAMVDCLADDVERDGIRVGMVTIDGDLPTEYAELAHIADLYWWLYMASDRHHGRELRFRVKPPVHIRPL